jgi:hypothetical protein
MCRDCIAWFWEKIEPRQVWLFGLKFDGGLGFGMGSRWDNRLLVEIAVNQLHAHVGKLESFAQNTVTKGMFYAYGVRN